MMPAPGMTPMSPEMMQHFMQQAQMAPQGATPAPMAMPGGFGAMPSMQPPPGGNALTALLGTQPAGLDAQQAAMVPQGQPMMQPPMQPPPGAPPGLIPPGQEEAAREKKLEEQAARERERQKREEQEEGRKRRIRENR